MRGATSQAALNRKAAGIDPLPDPAHSERGRKGAAVTNGKDPRKAKKRVAQVAGKKADKAIAEAQRFALLTLDAQRVRNRQAVSVAVNHSPEIMQRMVNIAMGKGIKRGDLYIAPGFKEQIAAARLVFDVAQVTGAQAESTSKARDATLNEVEVSDLRALLDAIETAKASQTVTVEGRSERVSTDWRQAPDRIAVSDAEIIAESTACEGSSPDIHSDDPFGAVDQGATDGATGNGQAGG